MSDIYNLLNESQRIIGGLSAEYIDKMMHPIPEIEVVSREQFILGRAKGKVVLDVGCTGKLSEAIGKVAKEYHGIDFVDPSNVYCSNYYNLNLDKIDNPPYIQGLELVIASEIVEHLSNAGHFMDLLRQYSCPVILTVPNAHSAAGHNYIKHGIECVNGEHVAYYSYHTLKILVERHGFSITEWYWYNGKPGTAEGLIFCLE